MDERSETLLNLFSVIFVQIIPEKPFKIGDVNSIPDCSPWAVFFRLNQYLALTLNKRKVVFFCHTARCQNQLESEKKGPKIGSLKSNITLQLDLFCKREEKLDEISYVQPFLSSYKNKNLQKRCKIMDRRILSRLSQKQMTIRIYHIWLLLQRRPLFPGLEKRDSLLSSAGVSSNSLSAPRSSPVPLLARWSEKNCLLPRYSLEYSVQTQGHFVSGRAIFTETFPAGFDDQDQPRGFEYEPSRSSTSDLCNWKKTMPSYRDDLKKMETPFTSVLTNHHHPGPREYPPHFGGA